MRTSENWWRGDLWISEGHRSIRIIRVKLLVESGRRARTRTHTHDPCTDLTFVHPSTSRTRENIGRTDKPRLTERRTEITTRSVCGRLAAAPCRWESVYLTSTAAVCCVVATSGGNSWHLDATIKWTQLTTRQRAQQLSELSTKE